MSRALSERPVVDRALKAAGDGLHFQRIHYGDLSDNTHKRLRIIDELLQESKSHSSLLVVLLAHGEAPEPVELDRFAQQGVLFLEEGEETDKFLNFLEKESSGDDDSIQSALAAAPPKRNVQRWEVDSQGYTVRAGDEEAIAVGFKLDETDSYTALVKSLNAQSEVR